eukprot:COSAG02_NODE_23_length_52893_cov_58.101868_61_plen_43_part_01
MPPPPPRPLLLLLLLLLLLEGARPAAARAISHSWPSCFLDKLP